MIDRADLHMHAMASDRADLHTHSTASDRADLHTHSTASDGLHAPAEVVRKAAEAGLGAMALTDHDTVAGVPEALAAGADCGVVVVPGVEISTTANGLDVHVLGYGMDLGDAGLAKMLRTVREGRGNRNLLILERLSAMGMPLSLGEVEAVAGRSARGDRTIGRPHIAQALVDKGWASSVKDAFDRLLGQGKPAYASVPRISPLEAVRCIQLAGGVAVVAHPGLYGDDDLTRSLLEGGADGLEAYHSDHDETEERKYAKMAAAAGKFVTGGSDFHGEKDGVVFHGPVGGKTVDIAVLSRLLRRSGG